MNELQAAFDAIDETVPVHAEYDQQLVRAKVRGLMRGYHARWINAGYEAVSVEQIYESDLWNPATQAKSRTFRIGGKIDVVASLNNRTFVIDHKTTSFDIADPNADYWRQLAIEGQVSHYWLLQWLHGIKVDGAIWDVIRKPGISPKALSKADLAAAVGNGVYCNAWLSDEDRLQLTREPRETLDMYEARLANDCTTERPDWYFQRRGVPRLDNEIIEYAKDLWDVAQELLLTRRNDRHLKNPGACMLYNSACKFLGLCSGHDEIESDRWRNKEFVHRELGSLDRDLLTTSRVRTYQTCRRKHFYEYELGIERSDAEEKATIFFGNVCHEALRAWWECFLPSEDSHDDSDAARIECANVGGLNGQPELPGGSLDGNR